MLLRDGELSVHGRLVAASNATFQGGSRSVPRPPRWCTSRSRGSGRCGTSRTARWPSGSTPRFLVSEALGWSVVPPTLLRDGPLGTGMVQLWIDEVVADDNEAVQLVDIVPQGRLPAGWIGVLDAFDGRHNPVTLVHADDPALQRMAVFDAVVNNADRKGGHVLDAGEGRVHGVDHGVTFNADDKLRTVLWGWAGTPVPAELLAEVERLDGELAGASAPS